MEKLKQYLPYIVIGVVILYLIRRMGSTTKTTLVPQTSFTETQAVDPFIEARSKAFDILAQLGIAETEAGIERERIRTGFAIASKGLDVELKKAEFLNQSMLQGLNLNFLEREQDRQIQQSAIDRFYSSRTKTDIIGSIGQTLGNIFGNRNSGTIFGTPPTFPRF